MARQKKGVQVGRGEGGEDKDILVYSQDREILRNVPEPRIEIVENDFRFMSCGVTSVPKLLSGDVRADAELHVRRAYVEMG